MSARWPSRGVSTNASEPASRTMLAIVFRLDHAGVEIGVPISTGVEGISAAVRVDQIDTAGDGADTVDDSG